MTVLINFFGGPGAGKSTAAAATFARLKQRGVTCELAREWAQDVIWHGGNPRNLKQLHIAREQSARHMRLHGKVDVVITDSPVLLGAVYAQSQKDAVEPVRLHHQEVADFEPAIHVVLRRPANKKFDKRTRVHTKKEALAIDERIRAIVDDEEHHEVDAHEAPSWVEEFLRQNHPTVFCS